MNELTPEQRSERLRELREWAEVPAGMAANALRATGWNVERAKEYLRVGPTEPPEIQRELLELVTKAGRRCAHDLSHAATSLLIAGDRESSNMYASRANEWLEVFYPDRGPKDYRARLHNEIDRLELRVRELEKLCEEHGIDHGGEWL